MSELKAEHAAAREYVRALQYVWLIAYRHMPADRFTLDRIGEVLDELLEKYG